MAVLIKNGIIADPEGSYRGDVLIEGEKIAAAGSGVLCSGENIEIIDAEGMYVLPGGVDPHTHVMLKAGRHKVSDGFKAATKAALLGGTTAIADHPSFMPEGSPLSAAVSEEKAEGEKGSFTDFGIHIVFQPGAENAAQELPKLVRKGYPTGKIYTTYDGMTDDRGIFDRMLQMKAAGGLLFFHCENDAITRGLRAESEKAGKTAPAAWPASRPDYTEAEAVKRVLALARAADAPVYIVHLSTQAALEEIIKARRAGQTVYAETCPQYLLLTEEAYKKENGLDFVMAPPLRNQADCNRLWKALAQGDIDTVGTDHCSFSRAAKIRAGASSVFKAPGGVPGVETRMELLFSEGVMKGRLSLERFAAVTAANPAKLLGFRDKGRIKAGADADIIIIDPNAEKTLSAETLYQKADYTPFEGITIKGCVTDVWLRGSRAVKDGELAIKRPFGRSVIRSLLGSR